MSNGRSAHVEGIRLEEVVGLLRRRTGTVAATACLVFLATFAWVGTHTPVYRASATVLIDGDQGESGLLSELAALGSAPAAASEIAILSSRSIAQKVVSAPDGVRVPCPGTAGFERHLGLGTTVDDERLLPLSTLWERLVGGNAPDGALFARVESASAQAPRAVRVTFPTHDTVRIARAGLLARLGIGADEETFPYEPEGLLDYRGLALRLVARGTVLDHSFRVRHVSDDLAVRHLLESTRIVETERDSGVVLVTVDASDPVRAARIADALCRNYFDLNVERGSKRASQTVEFIAAQLESQLSDLESAEREVVLLRESHPETIDVSTSASVLIQRLSDLEVERVHLELAHAGLDESIGLLAAHDLDALSRLGDEIADPISRGYIEQIGALTAEFELQDRGDGGPYKLLLQSKLERLSSEADELGVEADALRAVVEAYANGEDGALAGLTGRAGDGYGVGPLVAGYLERISNLEAEHTELAQVYTQDFPRLAEIRSAVSELRERVLHQLRGRSEALAQLGLDRAELLERTRAILAEYPGEEREKIGRALDNIRARTIEHLEARSQGVASRRSALAGQIAVLEERLGQLPEKERRLAGPMRRLEAHTEIVRFLLKSKQDAEIARAATVGTADFIDPAAPPIRRYAPRVTFTLVMGALFGVLAGLGLAYLRERFRGSIHTEAELEAASGLPVLGAIPDFSRGRLRHARGSEGFLALRDDPGGPIAEAYRSLRANLRFALGGDREIHTLAVTSCTPGEGKSTTNADLAIAFANGNKRVLLVDADLRKPTVHWNFGQERAPGLAEVLTDELDWRRCVRPSGIDGLDLLTAGIHTGKPGDLLSRPDVGELVDDLSGAYDVVVFDLPPALVVADVEIFAHKLDAILLLYRADGISREAVASASARLRQTGSNTVGCVLNAVRSEHGRGGAYYTSYYEYRPRGKQGYRKGA